MQGVMGLQGIKIKNPKDILCFLGIHGWICEVFVDDLGNSYFSGEFICKYCKKRKYK